ncbi:hydrolase [Pseudomonas wadenswilerensis]
MLISNDQATLLVVDVQEKLISAMTDPGGTVRRIEWLLKVCGELEIPIVFSEQYPRGLGATLAELKEAAGGGVVVEKVHFSCVAGNCLPASLLAREQVILCGIETHVCVLQTALELRALGKQVFVVEDATDCRSPYSHGLGIQRMRDAGVQIVTREMVVFESLHTASHEKFRSISKTFLVGEQP